MKEQIKELRVKIDGIAKLTKELKPFKEILIVPLPTKINVAIEAELIYKKDEICIIQNSKEIEKAVDSISLSKAWMGEILRELGEENSSDTMFVGVLTKAIIDWDDKTHIEKVKWLITEIEKVIELTDPYRNEGSIGWSLSTKGMSYLFNANRHLLEARFKLGWELERVKNEDQ